MSSATTRMETGTGDLVLTEQRNALSEDIDVKSSLEIVEIINREDRRVAQAVFEARASIATAVDWVAQAFQKGGRLIYVGAGTSGRLGVLDAAECPPTFGVDSALVQAAIAGGKRALTRAVEGAEDQSKEGEKDLQEKRVGSKDIVIGISSGSTASYVRGALKMARRAKAKTVFLTCTPLSERGDFADLIITVLTGPEVVTGSTRMKAGSATKMVLNMISTGAMIRTGRTYGNQMVDLSCSNKKLIQRGIRIIESATRLSSDEAKKLLLKAKRNVKTALAMSFFGMEFKDAERLLQDNRGFLRRLFQTPHRKNSKIDAVLFDMDGTIVHYNLPVGFSTWAALGWALQIFNDQEDWVDKYLSKKMSFEDVWEACAKRISGRTVAEIKDVFFPCAGQPPLSRGFSDCVEVLRGSYLMGIVSSGMSIVAEEIMRNQRLDFEYSNGFGISDGVFDGTTKIEVHFDHKVDVVRDICKNRKLSLDRICFVGDSMNDVEVFKAVGYPVAYNPKSSVVPKAAKDNVIGDFLQLPRMIEQFT